VSHAQYTLPNLTDAPPFAGSASDNAAVKPPFGPDESSGQGATTIGTPKAGQETLTFASLPLSFMGNQIDSITSSDQHAFDLSDVATRHESDRGERPERSLGMVSAGLWSRALRRHGVQRRRSHYTSAPEHASYIVHHNGPQYFGYLGDNTTEQGNMHGLQQFYTDVAAGKPEPEGRRLLHPRRLLQQPQPNPAGSEPEPCKPISPATTTTARTRTRRSRKHGSRDHQRDREQPLLETERDHRHL
jgi:hypothetical protein